MFKSIALSVIAASALLLPVAANADVVLSTQAVVAAPGSSDMFDVLLTNTGPSAVNIAAFNFTLTTSNADLTFTDVTTATTTAPYIFPNSLFGPDITTVASGQTVEAGDLDLTGNGTDVAPGATFGIGEVSFNVSASALSAIAAVDFSPYPDTSLSDASGDNVAFTTSPGDITIATTAAVPEPSEFFSLALAIPALSLWMRLRRGRVA